MSVRAPRSDATAAALPGELNSRFLDKTASFGDAELGEHVRLYIFEFCAHAPC
jgi:hypothetical protein